MLEKQRQHEILTAELRGHEAALARLSAELRQRGEARPSLAPDAERIFISAQILKHRIAVALLASRLAPRATRG